MNIATSYVQENQAAGREIKSDVGSISISIFEKLAFPTQALQSVLLCRKTSIDSDMYEKAERFSIPFFPFFLAMIRSIFNRERGHFSCLGHGYISWLADQLGETRKFVSLSFDLDSSRYLSIDGFSEKVIGVWFALCKFRLATTVRHH